MEALDLSDLAFRFRLAIGRIGLAMASGSLRSIVDTIEPLLRLVDQVPDPMVKSSFLARVAETQVIRAHYDAAHVFARRALAIAEDLHLDFAIGLCLIPRMNAEIGRRQFAAARQTLTLLTRISMSHEDPYLEIAREVSRLKLALSDRRYSLRDADAADDSWQSTQPAARAEYLSLRALHAAAQGDVTKSKEASEEAQALSRGIESTFNCRFAELIAQKTATECDAFRREVAPLVLDCSDAEAFDSLVLGCRIDADIARAAADDVKARLIVQRTLLRAADERLAARAGLMHDDSTAQRSQLEILLTPREREVLNLLSGGLSNSAIAAALVISESTAKVHVHHILEKLGVETRLQAVLKAREFGSELD
jgi:ATP/maltotriose-dependent transcriptional regulator MalT